MAIKVLVVDDSAFMRAYLRRVLESQPDMEVHTAQSGEEALAKIPELKPDVVTLDVHMPGMDGLSCLRRIMAQFPRPVLMVSSLTQRGAWQTLEALQLGAVDYIPKPQASEAVGGSAWSAERLAWAGDRSLWAAELVEKVRAAAKARLLTGRFRSSVASASATAVPSGRPPGQPRG